jgi:hypothetical protein
MNGNFGSFGDAGLVYDIEKPSIEFVEVLGSCPTAGLVIRDVFSDTTYAAPRPRIVVRAAEGVCPEHGFAFDGAGRILRNSIYGPTIPQGLTGRGDEIFLGEWFEKTWNGGPRRLDLGGAPVVCVTHSYSGVLAHHMLENMYFAHLCMRDQDLDRGCPIFVGRSDLPGWALEGFHRLGMPRERYFLLPTGTLVKGDIAVSEVAYARTWSHPGLREFGGHLRRLLVNRAAGESRVYISRRDTALRRLENEDELERALAAKGFFILRPWAVSFAEQFNVVAGADVVVATHGSGLATLICGKAGGLCVELRPAGVEGRDPLYDGSYLRLTHCVGMRYGVIIAPRSETDSWTVDVPSVIAILNRVA